MLEQLFKFPIVMVDGDNEDRKIRNKERYGALPNAEEEDADDYDMVFGEAEYPYWDLIGIEDRWLPSKESFNKAMAGQFEACIVRFVNVGQLLVPWSKKKFKSALLKFAEEYDNNHPKEKKNVNVRVLSPEEFKKIKGQIEEDGQ